MIVGYCAEGYNKQKIRQGMFMKSLSIKASWILTIVYWLIGLVCLFLGGIKNIKNPFGIILIIVLIPPLIVSICRTLKIKLPHLLTNILTAAVYFLLVVCAAAAYKMQWATLLLRLYLFCLH